MSVSIHLVIEKFDVPSKQECTCVWEGQADIECFYCQGTGISEVHVARFTSINMSNLSWTKVTSFINLPLFGEDLWCGGTNLEQTSTWLKGILKAKNSNGAERYTESASDERAHAPRMAKDEGGMYRISQGCRVLSQAYTGERLLRHVEALESALQEAQKHGCGIMWS